MDQLRPASIEARFLTSTPASCMIRMGKTWVLCTAAVQEDVPLQMYVYPAVEGTPLPDVFTENAGIVDEPYTLSPARIGAQRDEWIREWTGTVLR